MSLPNTSFTLLDILINKPDNRAWSRFFDMYAGVIVAFALRRGLDEHTARDVLQESMLVVHRKIGGFARRPGVRFSTWLLGIAHNKVLRARQRLTANGRLVSLEPGAGSTAQTHWLHNIPDDNAAPDYQDEAAWQRAMLATAMERVRNKLKNKAKLDAFRDLVLHEMPPKDVAAKHGINENLVYQLKHQITDMLRAEIAALDAPPANNS